MSTRVTATYPYTSDPGHFDSCIRIIKGGYHAWIFAWTWIVHNACAYTSVLPTIAECVCACARVWCVCMYSPLPVHLHSLPLSPTHTPQSLTLTYTSVTSCSLTHSLDHSITHLLTTTHSPIRLGTHSHWLTHSHVRTHTPHSAFSSHYDWIITFLHFRYKFSNIY